MHPFSPSHEINRIINEVKSAPTPKTRGGYCKLILALRNALEKNCTEEQQAEIAKLMDKLCDEYLELSKHYVDFLDIPFEERKELYYEMTTRGSARDACHLGELLLMEGENAGTQLIVHAAAEGDIRAIFITAKLMVDGMYDCPKDPKKAVALLRHAAENNYAPALELMASLYWDGNGNWDFPRNRDKAQVLMDAAVKLYSKYSFSSGKHKIAYENHCACMRHIAGCMQNLRNGGLEQLYPGFYPSYLALQLSFYPINEEGLRARAHYICEYMAHYGQTFYLGQYYWGVKLPLISLEIEPPNDSHLGCTYAQTHEDKIYFHISIAPFPEERTSTFKTYWNLQYQISSTLAHELAHCYLIMEYNNQLQAKHPLTLPLVEGHATNTQYQFARLNYYKGVLAPSRFIECLSSSYAKYFFDFKEAFIQPDGLADWDKITQVIEHVSEGNPRIEVEQQPIKETYETPLFYGLGFNGYV